MPNNRKKYDEKFKKHRTSSVSFAERSQNWDDRKRRQKSDDELRKKVVTSCLRISTLLLLVVKGSQL